jgi:acetyl esterase/lipase
VLVVHGGSWQRGSKSRMAPTAARLAARGYVAVSIDYRLAPANQFPAQLYDCEEALRWMRANSERLHLDPAHIGGFGYSAGAHLVALLATTGPADGLEEVAGGADGDARLQAAVLGGAPVDLGRFFPNPAMRLLLGAWPGERPDVYAMASPITFVTPMTHRFLYGASGGWSTSQAREMSDALRRAGYRPVTTKHPAGRSPRFSSMRADRPRHRLPRSMAEALPGRPALGRRPLIDPEPLARLDRPSV